MARPRNPTRAANLRHPDALHAIGHLSDFPERIEVGRRWTPERPSAEEERNGDPVVYLWVGVMGRKPPADLFYLVNDEHRRVGKRVYFIEVVKTDA